MIFFFSQGKKWVLNAAASKQYLNGEHPHWIASQEPAIKLFLSYLPTRNISGKYKCCWVATSLAHGLLPHGNNHIPQQVRLERALYLVFELRIS